MTDIFLFLIDFIADTFRLALSFKFEFFGQEVSVMSLILAGIVVCTLVSFLKIERSSIFDDSLRFIDKANSRDKKKEKKQAKENKE